MKSNWNPISQCAPAWRFCLSDVPGKSCNLQVQLTNIRVLFSFHPEKRRNYIVRKNSIKKII